MPFSADERAVLIAVKGVGPTVIKRFEELGINSLAALSKRTADDICGEVSGMLGTTCWKNAPRAKQAVSDAIAAAQAVAVQTKSVQGQAKAMQKPKNKVRPKQRAGG